MVERSHAFSTEERRRLELIVTGMAMEGSAIFALVSSLVTLCIFQPPTCGSHEVEQGLSHPPLYTF